MRIPVLLKRKVSLCIPLESNLNSNKNKFECYQRRKKLVPTHEFDNDIMFFFCREDVRSGERLKILRVR